MFKAFKRKSLKKLLQAYHSNPYASWLCDEIKSSKHLNWIDRPILKRLVRKHLVSKGRREYLLENSDFGTANSQLGRRELRIAFLEHLINEVYV